MAFCYQCGEELEFFHNGFTSIPIHPSGSCSGRGGGGSFLRPSIIRTTSQGNAFEFPFTNYPSYTNPNARCPVCDAAVYFYQSPYGGRVFFDDLGPPWPKHPCTDNPQVHRFLESAESRALILTPIAAAEVEVASSVEHLPRLLNWQKDGWMPFVITRIVSHPIGIEAEGTLFECVEGNVIPFRIQQFSVDANFYRRQREVHLGYQLVQNSHQIISVLNESPIMLKKSPDLNALLLSSFILSEDNTAEEITFPVFGQMITPPES